MECHGISRILGSKALTKKDKRPELVLWLKVVKEHAIMHRDVCSLSSLIVMPQKYHRIFIIKNYYIFRV